MVSPARALASADALSVLIVEDDTSLNELLSRQLEQRGYSVTGCLDGRDALQLLESSDFDLVLLDWMLPEIDGIEVLAQIRAERDMPVIMLTACGSESERIQGLQCGADDYLTKPFNITELMLRIEGLIRRCGNREKQVPGVLNYKGLQLCQQQHQLSFQQQLLELTPTEYGLIQLLMQQPGDVLGKPELYQQLMGRPWSRYDRSLDMHMSKLRKKLTAVGFDASLLQTVHGRGYRLR